ncbi:GGDEF domain-containing response regulator [Arcobacter roscoffensis]|uniref:Diguanylate cyclase n=1 Tax=Arcobacter roscoffensis TaxID=2961520 RepID=A0ABY5DZG6_9BACT|nr:diguanylate cyclase [Arcobacter roscoffensis]UTJ05344.1 diguanylate cyclase [Arcobacter roscoffensis]
MKKILLVDNSKLIINVLEELFLEKNNFEIYKAKTLNEVEQLILSNNFFIAISNLVLPDALNGELLDTFKNANIPTIVLSSKIDDSFMSNIDNLNIIDYVSKDSIHGLENVYDLAELLLYIKDTKVLVVEDSNVVAQQIKATLETLFLKVKTVPNGDEALNELKNNKDISMVISDYNMPKMNGLELTRAIRKDKTTSSLPIVIISSDNNPQQRIKLFKNGANDYLNKPILEEELKSKVLDTFSNIKKIEDIQSFNKIFDENIITSSTDIKGNIQTVSKAFCKISGYEKEELIGKSHNIVRHPDMPKCLYEELWNTITKGQTWKGEIKNLKKDGTYYWVKAVIEPKFNRNGDITGYFAIREDISDKKRIYELSITDGLTSLYNRRYFNDTAHNFILESVRNNNTFAFILLDIDNFKKYNDTYGHQDGDDVLIKVANSLKTTFKRGDDQVFRLGGEEFGVLISSKTKLNIMDLVEEARLNIEKLNIKHEKNTPLSVVTASFGTLIISLGNNENIKVEDIYKKADEQLYKAKENGRNKIEYLEL